LQHDLHQFQRDFAVALDRPARGAMAVYRNTVLHGAVEALRANFRVVEQIVGTEMFEQVAVDFATTCPPRRPVLALYGAEFSDWLRRQPWTADFPYLADVAKVERLCVECLLAADADALSIEDIGQCDTERLEVELHPALRFNWFSTPAMSIWLAHQWAVPSEIDLDWKPEGALFARPRGQVVHSPRIGRAAHRILCGIRINESVQAAILAARRLYPDTDCAAIFMSLVNLGAFIAPSSERKLS
jgi:hypothetical protein